MRKLLYPFALLYGAVTAVRNRLFDYGSLPSERYDIPVISVGNLSAGGTGKTPVTKYIGELLQDKFRTNILSRGYGRKTKGFRTVSESSQSHEVGDEPLQLYRSLPNTEVAVCEDRRLGIQTLLHAENPPEVILLDDAFQHRWVRPSLSILLTTYQNPYYTDLMLPAGNLRESAIGAKRAHIIMVTKTPDNLSIQQSENVRKQLNLTDDQQLFFSGIAYSPLQSLSEPDKVTPVIVPSDKLLVVTGIAQPGPLIDHLGQLTTKFAHLSFPDHHHFTEKDLKKIEKEAITCDKVIITEKDAVKLASLLKNRAIYPKVYVQPISINVLFNQKEQFNSLILNHVTANK